MTARFYTTVILRLGCSGNTLPMRNPFAAVTLLLCGTGLSFAQSTFGVIVGTLKDASGAVLSGASVRLTNLGENIARDTTTGGDGTYEFQNTKPELYSVAMSHAGFRTFEARDLPLVARQTLRVDAALPLGEVSERVEVQATAGVIATDSAAIGGLGGPAGYPCGWSSSACATSGDDLAGLSCHRHSNFSSASIGLQPPARS